MTKLGSIQKVSSEGQIEAATTARRALEDLASRTKAGITYDSYLDRLGDARSSIDAYNHEFGSDRYSERLESAFKHFAYARDVWDVFRSRNDGNDLILINSALEHDEPTVLSSMLLDYPNLKKLVVGQDGDEYLSLDASLLVIWTKAQQTVSRLADP
jgi:hypothetical protein